MSNNYEFHHTCPRHCFSNCTMISSIENNRLVTLHGKKSHPYTKGKLCAKGYSYIERNNRHDRLKYPYYQEVKGSGKFKQITWKKAFDILTCELLNIHNRDGNFLPLALMKGSGNVGVHHYVTEQFFTSLGQTTRIKGAASSPTGFEAIKYDMGAVKMSDPTAIREASMIMIWGANPAATNIHLIPLMIEAKAKGAKLVVIDPVYTQTAELADLYIQVRPSTDGALANLLIKELIETNQYDKEFINHHSHGFEAYFEAVRQIPKQEILMKCGMVEEALTLLFQWVAEAGAVSHIIGMGLLKHANGGQNLRAIEALAAVHGDIGKKGGGIFFRRLDNDLFQNQLEATSENNRILHLNENRILPSEFHTPIDMLWISCANPLVQEPDPPFIERFLRDIPFVVTVDLFMTPTAKMSNLILPTTSHFEETDIITSYWHKEMSLNEKAIPPFHESLSEWKIMNELALSLKEKLPNASLFPIYSSEEEYLDAQFTEQVQNRFFVKSIAELKEKRVNMGATRTVWEKRRFATNTGMYHFHSTEAEENGLPPLPLYVEKHGPTNKHPFWLITPHAPFTFNSQFHFLHLSGEKEALVEIHPKVAEGLSILDGEVIQIYNGLHRMEIKAAYSHRVPRDILVIHQAWYSNSEVNVNQLVPVIPTDMGQKIAGTKGTAFYDTFVNIAKL